MARRIANASLHVRNSAGLDMMRTPLGIVCRHVMETCDRIYTASFDPSIWGLQGLTSVPAFGRSFEFAQSHRTDGSRNRRAPGVRPVCDTIVIPAPCGAG